MEKKEDLAHFIKYNNTVPIVLGILFLSTSATLAATPAVRESVYAEQTAVVSIDNSYLLSVDLADYPFTMRITKVTEDDLYFYVSYELDTVDVLDAVWQDVRRPMELRVYKQTLGAGDFEAFVESELAQVRSAELARLQKTQADHERIGMSEKVVTTEFRGIVGKFFEPTEERVPQYITVIDKDDPLRLKKPQKMVTWDQNAQPEEEERPRDDEDDDTPPPPTDQCPDMEGMQTSASECPSGGGGGGGEEPPVEEPPVEEPPAEEPPAEEPPPSDPGPTEGDSGGDSGEGEGGGDAGGGEGGGGI